jgi:hypothetical protein
MALVRVTLCVERISFMLKRCRRRAKKSSFYFAEKLGSEIRAKMT